MLVHSYLREITFGPPSRHQSYRSCLCRLKTEQHNYKLGITFTHIRYTGLRGRDFDASFSLIRKPLYPRPLSLLLVLLPPPRSLPPFFPAHMVLKDAPLPHLLKAQTHHVRLGQGVKQPVHLPFGKRSRGLGIAVPRLQNCGQNMCAPHFTSPARRWHVAPDPRTGRRSSGCAP